MGDYMTEAWSVARSLVHGIMFIARLYGEGWCSVARSLVHGIMTIACLYSQGWCSVARSRAHESRISKC